jgi:NADPH:quinone reductase-like Zn-dependent oxidoreductase
MKAIVQDVYGSAEVLQLRDIGQPSPGDGEVLIQVRAAGADPGVWHMMTGVPYLMRVIGFGFRRPRLPVRGLALSGVVVAAGPGASRFQPGDEVFGSCRTGSFAEYAVAREGRLTAKPAKLTFEQAAALPVSALTALQAVRDQAKVRAGQRVMITGAGGGIGTFAVQLAKARGASVTGVCGPAKADLVRSLGADSVIDYTRKEIDSDGRRYDAIIDISGSRPLSLLRRALAPGGVLVLTGGDRYDRPVIAGMSRQIRAPFISLFTSQRLRAFIARENAADYQALAQLAETGAITPVIDRTYPLADAADAIRRIAAGHAVGKGIITIGQ